MEFILIGIILIFVMTYRNSSGEGIYKFVKDSATSYYIKDNINGFIEENQDGTYTVNEEKIEKTKIFGKELFIDELTKDALAGNINSNKLFL